MDSVSANMQIISTGILQVLCNYGNWKKVLKAAFDNEGDLYIA